MRFSLFLFLLCITVVRLPAQINPDSVYVTAQNPPVFPGCSALTDIAALKKCSTKNLYSWVFNTIRYPLDALQYRRSGTVIVSLVINTDGSISDPTIIKSPYKTLSKEALRIFNVMNDQIKWTPASIQDTLVRFKMVVPIKFQIETLNQAIRSDKVKSNRFVVFQTKKGVDVFRGRISLNTLDKIPSVYVKSSLSLETQRSLDLYKVLDAIVIKFKPGHLSRPTVLESRNLVALSQIEIPLLSAQYEPQLDQIKIFYSELNQPVPYYIHNLQGDILNEGLLDQSKGSTELVDTKTISEKLLLVSIVKHDLYTTLLVSK